MLGTLPTHATKNWQEWIATLTHAYNCTISSVTGFSPYFLMFGHNPKIPLDVEIWVTDRTGRHFSSELCEETKS